MEREQIGQFIFEERTRQGFSQKEFAMKAGITRQRVAEIEKNKYNYGVDALISCLKVLNFELEAVSCNDEEKEAVLQEEKKTDMEEGVESTEETDNDW